MPELAEVQVIADQLHSALTDSRIDTVTVTHPAWVKHGDVRNLVGATVDTVERWGKRIELRMTDGAVVVVGLGMTGTVTLLRAVTGHLYEHEVCRMHVGSHAVVFADARKFGSALMFPSSEEAHRYLDGKIGVDAYSALTAVQLRDIIGTGSAKIKAALLDQARLAGIGNYLADEILHHARLLPTRTCTSLTDRDWVALNKARMTIIERALAAGGMSMRDYVDTAGRKGRMTEHLRVYGRRDQPCGSCGGHVARTEVAGRTSWYCPACQQ